MFFTKPHTLGTKFTFGKYINETVKDVMTIDPYYVAWCEENIDGFSLDLEASKLLDVAREDYEAEKEEDMYYGIDGW